MFVDLMTVSIELEEYSQRWQDKLDARRKYGGGLSELERADWRKGFNELVYRYHGSPIRKSINRTGEKKIKNRDPVSIETGILYLEVDPYEPDSGYTKEWILDQLKYLDLTPYVSRLQSLMLHIVDTHYCREFRHYCKVAPRIDGKDFQDALRSRLNNPDPNVIQRAQWLLDFLGRYSKIW